MATMLTRRALILGGTLALSAFGGLYAWLNTTRQTPEGVKVNKADIPVGSGKALPGGVYLVTQPTDGTFKAFSRKCPHGFCDTINVTKRGTILCECHGSVFEIDGRLKRGPATRGLYAKDVTEHGDAIYISEPEN